MALAKGNGKFSDGIPALSGGYYSVIEGWDHTKSPCLLSDINGDGKADIVGFGQFGVGVSLARGNGVFHPRINTLLGTYASSPIGVNGNANQIEAWNSDTSKRRITILADVDGDGSADIVGFNRNELWATLANNKKEHITSIRDGYNNTTTINYKPLTDPNVYKKGSGASYPTIDVANRTHVVAEFATSNAVGSTNKKTWTYEGFKSDRLKGSGSFSKTTSVDHASGIIETVNFDATNNRYLGMPVSKEVKLIDGRVVSKTTNTLARLSNGIPLRFLSFIFYLSETKWFPYYSKTETLNYEVNNGILTDRIIMDFVYDKWGNAVKNTTSHIDGH